MKTKTKIKKKGFLPLVLAIVSLTIACLLFYFPNKVWVKVTFGVPFLLVSLFFFILQIYVKSSSSKKPIDKEKQEQRRRFWKKNVFLITVLLEFSIGTIFASLAQFKGSTIFAILFWVSAAVFILTIIYFGYKRMQRFLHRE